MLFRSLETRSCYVFNHQVWDATIPGEDSILYSPSINWAQGGPIIELEEITLAWGKDTEDWWACVGDSRRFDTDTPDGVTTFVDPQPLIAAMRCYVASKLGDDVEIPEELKL